MKPANVRLSGAARLLPDAILCAGLAAGLFLRARFYTNELFAAPLAVGAVALLLRRFVAEAFGALVHVCIGFALGVVSLFDIGDHLMHRFNDLEDLANALLVASVVGASLVHLVDRCCRAPTAERLWHGADLCQVVGVSAACLFADDAALPLLLLLLAFCVSLSAVKLGSFIAVLNLAFLVISAEKYLFPDLHVAVNPFGFICFVGRLGAAPLLDLLAGGATRLDRWSAVICAGRWRLRLAVAFVVVIEATFLATSVSAVLRHKEWYVVVPLFAFFAFNWAATHIIFVAILCTLVRRFGELAGHRSTDARPLNELLAARGLRYFSLVAARLTAVVVVSSLLVAALTWTTRTPFSHALVSLVCAFELMVAELLADFRSQLGGTCIGFGIVAPVVAVRSDGMTTVLPPNFIQECGARSTGTVQAVVGFFNRHVIANYACDWSMGGIGADGLRKKLDDFFAQTTAEGPRFDTYLLYYSGPTTPTGDWALAAGATLTLEQLVEQWRDGNAASPSRLLIICDCLHSDAWLKRVWRLDAADALVALQTFQPSRGDPEASLAVGQFSETLFAADGADAHFVGGRPLYAVSRRWTDFAFRQPDAHEVWAYWRGSAPCADRACVWPLVRALYTRWPVAVCSECVSRACKRLRLRIWPPADLDTGHGFALLRR